jgi:di/tripeptidase
MEEYNMKKIAKFGIIALLLISLVGSAIAFGGNEAARNAIKSGDYSAWKTAKISGLTEEKFNQMKNIHQENLERKFQMQEKNDEIETAIKEGYYAWVKAISDHPNSGKILEIINEDNFDRFVEMHESRKEGDHKTAKEIAEELGLKGPGIGRGFGKGNFEGRCPMED